MKLQKIVLSKPMRVFGHRGQFVAVANTQNNANEKTNEFNENKLWLIKICRCVLQSRTRSRFLILLKSIVTQTIKMTHLFLFIIYWTTSSSASNFHHPSPSLVSHMATALVRLHFVHSLRFKLTLRTLKLSFSIQCMHKHNEKCIVRMVWTYKLFRIFN